MTRIPCLKMDNSRCNFIWRGKTGVYGLGCGVCHHCFSGLLRGIFVKLLDFSPTLNAGIETVDFIIPNHNQLESVKGITKRAIS